MENYEALLATMALAMGVSWASGINLYAALLVLGVGGATGYIALPPDLVFLQDPTVVGAAGLMYFIEFFADKTPGVDTGWDVIHTFIRIPAGAMLAASFVGDVSPALEIAAGVLGGGVAATSHVTKTGTRLLINTSPEPVTNWAASITEDILVIAGLWAALSHPIIFLVLFGMFICMTIWLLPRLWYLIKKICIKIGKYFGLFKYESDVMARHILLDVETNKDRTQSALKRKQLLQERGALTEEGLLEQKRQHLEKNIK